ncbi:MAG: hypothetical protein ACI8WT_005085, partial [Clostridium sp.]
CSKFWIRQKYNNNMLTESKSKIFLLLFHCALDNYLGLIPGTADIRVKTGHMLDITSNMWLFNVSLEK